MAHRVSKVNGQFDIDLEDTIDASNGLLILWNCRFPDERRIVARLASGDFFRVNCLIATIDF